ncbi:MAG: DegT/DnrJ/EryC1/StrS family aminotransferase [Verrucomicrobiales bacterium]
MAPHTSNSPQEEIHVTRSFLPDRKDFDQYIDQIWANGQLTNGGPLVQSLESQLTDYLDVENLNIVCNGTIALQIAIEALELKDEVITTPFSYVATTSSLLWQHCEPVFADICPKTLNIDPEQIEAAVTPRTTGILATHIYGFPCDIDAIQEIADKHNLKVIYDAAHCFGVKYRGRGLMSYGDISITSFHATKVFHCAEGGALATSDPEIAQKISYMRNFGHDGPVKFQGIGINGKMSEFHAAMGLSNLPHVDEIVDARQKVVQSYRKNLDSCPEIRQFHPNDDCEWNSAYFPVLLSDERIVESAIKELNSLKIFPRRYFYPSLNQLPGINSISALPITEDLSSRVICLPIYPGLVNPVVCKISEILCEVCR